MERPKFSDKDKMPPRRPLRTGGQIARGERLHPSQKEINELWNWIEKQVPENLSIASEDEPDSFTPKVEQRLKDRILRAFGEEVSKKNQGEGKNRRTDWGPFLNEPDPENQRFIITYSGPYAQRLELNRRNAERLIDVAALDGRIIVADLVSDRDRSISGINRDGSVNAQRRAFFGQRLSLPTVRDQEREYHRVTSIPEGWRVEVAGQRILEDLAEKESKVPLEKRFVAQFNNQIRAAMTKIFNKDKFDISSPRFKYRLVYSFFPPALYAGWFIDGIQIRDLQTIPWILGTYGMGNLLSKFLYTSSGRSDLSIRKNLNSPYEIFMPPVEIDRHLRGLAFANLKGRNLVRLAKT